MRDVPQPLLGGLPLWLLYAANDTVWRRPFVPAFWKNFVMRPAHMAAQVSEVMLVPFFTCQGPGAAVC